MLKKSYRKGLELRGKGFSSQFQRLWNDRGLNPINSYIHPIFRAMNSYYKLFNLKIYNL